MKTFKIKEIKYKMQIYTNNMVLALAVLAFIVMGGVPRIKV